MYIRILNRLLACAFALCLLAGFNRTAASGCIPVTVQIDSRTLSSDVAPFAENGVSYAPLAAFAQAMGDCSVVWDGTAAHIKAPGLTVTAVPGTQWIEANGRCLYIPGGVRIVSGRTMIPVRTLAKIYGAQVGWDGSTATVSVSDPGQLLESGDTFYDADTLYWLSRVISAESRGEILTGQIAVGNVALNRVADPAFPDTLYGVIFQPGQFEPVQNGTIYNDPYYLSVIAAKLCLDGADIIGDCLYFFAPALSQGTWIVNNRTYYTTIGCHRFYL